MSGVRGSRAIARGELPAETVGERLERGHVGKPAMKAAREIHSELERARQWGKPSLGDDAAAVGDADDHRLGAARGRLLHRQVGKAEVGLAPGHAKLAERPFRAPIGDAARGLRRQLVRRVAEEEEEEGGSS